ncbi:MAG TPA: 2TM domain-containing protein [Reyranella sp.]|jgi:transcriptional regulator with XRE-family HTH domain|nr:2TM domain-containing protein [Reyranella sp.]
MTDDSPLLIQKLRLQRGWSQEQLAELAGLSARTVQRIERGQTPSAESLKAIAAVLDVHFAELREAHMAPIAERAVERDVSDEEALALAKVRRIKGFYMHLVQYVLIVGFLAVVNLLTVPRHLWVQWAAIPWALALALHGLRVFDKVPFLNGDWERRQVEKYLGRKL